MVFSVVTNPQSLSFQKGALIPKMGTGKSMYDRDTDPEFFRNPLKMFLNEKDLPRPENHCFGTFDPMYGFPNGRKPRGEQHVEGVVKF